VVAKSCNHTVGRHCVFDLLRRRTTVQRKCLKPVAPRCPAATVGFAYVRCSRASSFRVRATRTPSSYPDVCLLDFNVWHVHGEQYPVGALRPFALGLPRHRVLHRTAAGSLSPLSCVRLTSCSAPAVASCVRFVLILESGREYGPRTNFFLHEPIRRTTGTERLSI